MTINKEALDNYLKEDNEFNKLFVPDISKINVDNGTPETCTYCYRFKNPDITSDIQYYKGKCRASVRVVDNAIQPKLDSWIKTYDDEGEIIPEEFGKMCLDYLSKVPALKEEFQAEKARKEAERAERRKEQEEREARKAAMNAMAEFNEKCEKYEEEQKEVNIEEQTDLSEEKQKALENESENIIGIMEI